MTSELDHHSGDLDIAATRRVLAIGGSASVSLDGLGRPGDTLGRYVLLRPLGAGGMSVVWLAYDPELDRRVALKLMHAGLLGERGSFGAGDQRLLREAQALARLSHVNVVRVYDVGALAGQVYIAMELVEGTTLREWSRLRPHPWRETLAVLLRAGRGLAAAHAAGLVHLDLKPSNVLVGDDGEVRVVDFGLAREPSEAIARPSEEPSASRSNGRLHERLTEDGAVLGTPGYIAPEVLRGHPADARADQFSFCVTAWEAMFGERPFEGEEYERLHRNVLAGRVREPTRPHAAPRWLRRALQRGLAVAPEQRFATMDELLAVLTPRSRTQALLWPVLALAAVPLGVTLFDAHATAAPPCDAIAAPLAEVWNPTLAGQAAAAFERTGTPYASASWRSASNLLDAYAELWTREARDACEATMVRAEQTEELLALRQSCFDDARSQLGAVVELFVAADATVVEHAVAAVLGIPSPLHCADLEALRAEASEPDDPGIRDAALAIDQQLGRIRASIDAGQVAGAALAATRTLERARELGHEPTIARALLVAANASSNAGDTPDAVALLDEALWLAERTGLDRLRLRVLAEQVYVVGHLQRDTARGRWFAALADAVQRRIGGSEELAWRLVIHRGVLAADAGEHDEALALFEQALAADEATGSMSGSRATLLMNIGSAHYERGDYGTALEFYQRALELERAQLGDDHPAIAVALENRANAEQALGRLEEALADHRRALAIHQRLGLLTGSAHAMLLNNVGVVLSGMRRWDEAIEYYQRARELLTPEESEHPLAAIAAVNIAEARLAQGRPAEALALVGVAHDQLIATLGAEHPYTAVAQTGLGLAQLELGDHAAARSSLEHALSVHRSGGDPLQLADTRLGLARVMIADGSDRSAARTLAQQVRTELLALGPRAELSLARVDRFLAETD